MTASLIISSCNFYPKYVRDLSIFKEKKEFEKEKDVETLQLMITDFKMEKTAFISQNLIST